MFRNGSLIFTNMKENAEKLMQSIWDARNSGEDTEEKLIAATLSLALEVVPQYNAQNGMIVIDKNDLLSLSTELRNLK